MPMNGVGKWFCLFFVISFLFVTCTDGKGFGGGRGGGFKGGSRGSGSFGGRKGAGTFGGSSGYNSMSKPRSGSNFKSNAMSFGVGALGGVAAYSLMSSMATSNSYRRGYYEPGYGVGETCVNNEDINGTRFGSFRCPLNSFPYEARYCCGEYGKQFCCIREASSRAVRSSSNFGWIFLLIVICLIVIFLFVKHRQQRQKGVIMIPMEPPVNEQQGPPFYHPPPPPMGYPQPPMGNPYAQNYEGNFNPHSQQQMPYQPQQQMPYPPQQQMPYPQQQQQQQQQQSFNPYQVKEGGPPAYDDVIRNNQSVPPTKPT